MISGMYEYMDISIKLEPCMLLRSSRHTCFSELVILARVEKRKDTALNNKELMKTSEQEHIYCMEIFVAFKLTFLGQFVSAWIGILADVGIVGVALPY